MVVVGAGVIGLFTAYELVRRGYDAGAIAKLWGGNFLRVMRAAECAHLAGREWGVLSQGERQRVLIARALMAAEGVAVNDLWAAAAPRLAGRGASAFHVSAFGSYSHALSIGTHPVTPFSGRAKPPPPRPTRNFP